MSIDRGAVTPSRDPVNDANTEKGNHEMLTSVRSTEDVKVATQSFAKIRFLFVVLFFSLLSVHPKVVYKKNKQNIWDHA